VNRQHLKTIIWLRWRLTANRLRRTGPLNAILTATLTIGAIIISIALFGTALFVGLLLLPKAEPNHLLYLWDAIVLVFLFSWTLGLVTELQRSDPLSLSKLLHLPVSPKGAFLCNYLSSLASLSVILFLPAMIGLSLASVAVKGAPMLLLFPLVASLLFMVSAVTYQFRGWVAALMVNKRRKRTIAAFITIGFILLTQTPNLFNIAYQRSLGRQSLREDRQSELAELKEQFERGDVTRKEYEKGRTQAYERYTQRRKATEQRASATALQVISLTNALLPVGWLPFGARAAVEGRLWPGVLGVLGASLLGAASLRGAYRTTLRYFTAGFQSQPTKSNHPISSKDQERKTLLVERTLPGLSERCSALSLTSLRSLLRAPEAKMVLLTALILMGVFGLLLLSNDLSRIPDRVRPLLVLALLGMALFSILQLIQNQFGFDRDGFRNFVLSPAPRSEILFAKNIALAPIALATGSLAIIATQILIPLQWSHFAASFLQLISIFLIFCLIGNLISILLPLRMSAGSMRPAHAKGTVVAAQFLALLLFPFALLPTWIPIGVDLLMQYLEWGPGIPFYLILSAAELAALLWIYRQIILRQGSLLQHRETRILETVTSKIE